MQLRPIDIDLDVHRCIEQRRRSFGQSPNDILREYFDLPPRPGAPASAPEGDTAKAGDWSWKGVTLPAGTELRMTYNGRTHAGTVAGGAWQIAGATYTSPSSAADALARSRDGKHVSLNGWKLWEARKPGSKKWELLDDLRPAASRTQRRSGKAA